MFPKDLGELTLQELQEADYQTKDLGETFVGHFYLKKKDGAHRLFKHDIEYTWVAGDPKGKSFMDRLGHAEEKSTKEILINDIGTNTVRVYNFFTKENHDYWVEFNVVFLENELLKVEVHEFRKENNEERKIQNLELRKEMEKSVKFSNSPIGKVFCFLRNIYYKTIVKVQLLVGEFFVKIGNKIKYSRLFR